jgi:hypothetical protein
MFTGVNDCCRIVRGAVTDLSGAELEASIRAMTGEAYTSESLVLPRGIKALCEDQAPKGFMPVERRTQKGSRSYEKQVGKDISHLA